MSKLYFIIVLELFLIATIGAGAFWINQENARLIHENMILKIEVSEKEDRIIELKKPAPTPIISAIRVLDNQRQIECLALNVYHESRGESIKGQRMVADVTLNRLKNGKFGKSICQVVYKKKAFSWTLDKNKKADTFSKQYKQAVKVAIQALNSKPTTLALYYHTKRVNPIWNRGLTRVATIGNHVFFNN